MLKLKRFDEGAWYDYEPGVRFKIKPLSRTDTLSIRLQCKRKMLVQGMDPPDNIVDDFDRSAILFESFKICLLDWDGVQLDGLKKPSRQEMIEALFQDPSVSDFVLTRAYQANEQEEKKLTDEIKNSERSQDGSPSSESST